MAVTIYTIGHGSEQFERIAALLDRVGLSTLIDVRSTPYSSHAPDFSRPELDRRCLEAGIGYRFLGRHLGGLPTDPDLLGADGEPHPASIEATPGFAADIGLLIELATGGPVAILCSEEDPSQCHRSTILTPALVAGGALVKHLRHDGSAQPHQEGLGI